jgi:hypothetical protein
MKMDLSEAIISEIKAGRTVAAIKLLRQERSISLIEAKKIIDRYHNPAKPEELKKSDINGCFPFIFCLALVFVIAGTLLTQGGYFWLKSLFTMFSILGLLVCNTNLQLLITSIKSSSWNTTTAKIIYLSINKHKTNSNNSYYYSPEAEYEYTVNGVVYTNNTISYNIYSSGSESYAQNVIDKIKSSSRPMIYYNRLEPKTSVIFPGISKTACIGLIVGIGFIATGVVGLLW